MGGENCSSVGRSNGSSGYWIKTDEKNKREEKPKAQAPDPESCGYKLPSIYLPAFLVGIGLNLAPSFTGSSELDKTIADLFNTCPSKRAEAVESLGKYSRNDADQDLSIARALQYVLVKEELPEIRAKAVRALGTYFYTTGDGRTPNLYLVILRPAEEVTSSILFSLKDKSPDVRKAALETLDKVLCGKEGKKEYGVLSPKIVLSAIVERLGDESEKVKLAAINLISKMRINDHNIATKATDLLIISCKPNNSPETRIAAILALADIDHSGRAVWEAFVQASKCDDPNIRKAAIHALASHQDEDTLQILIKIIRAKESSMEEKLIAIDAIRKSKNKKAIQPLENTLRRIPRTSHFRSIREAIKKALNETKAIKFKSYMDVVRDVQVPRLESLRDGY